MACKSLMIAMVLVACMLMLASEQACAQGESGSDSGSTPDEGFLKKLGEKDIEVLKKLGLGPEQLEDLLDETKVGGIDLGKILKYNIGEGKPIGNLFGYQRK